MRTPDDATVVWRVPIWGRLPVLVVTVLVGVLVLVEAVRNPSAIWAYLVLVVLLANVAGNAIRFCRLDQQLLTARGRTGARREVRLADLRQVGRGFGTVWVQTHGPIDARGNHTLCLRMIGATSFTGLPGAADAVGLIRRRAELAGAQLDAALPDPTNPPREKPLLFSI